MKCKSRTEYDCFYLDKSNIEEFVEWIKFFNFNILILLVQIIMIII